MQVSWNAELFEKDNQVKHEHLENIQFKPSCDDCCELPKRPLSIQEQSPSYSLAWSTNNAFLLRHDQRHTRLSLEFQKTDLILKDNAVNHTVVVFGGARIRPLHIAEKELNEARRLHAEGKMTEREVKIKETQVKNAHFYEKAEIFGRLVAQQTNMAVCTGGGPGIMEAASKGAQEAGSKTVGLNILLPHEQRPNDYITPELCFSFHYFSVRKMHFLLRARALVCFPGGFGTLDELFEALTLIQNQKMKSIPVVLFGVDFWTRLIDFEFLVENGTIDPKDAALFHLTDDPHDAHSYIMSFYA
ncbi:hypothetical protein EDD86DRAFT_206293 [Gorgonomyces haynaldii]|nr:hypothetical protein EDD86DRAFT_206293 [Gorgonomyces haynaldii]